jgi:hypothetical protein
MVDEIKSTAYGVLEKFLTDGSLEKAFKKEVAGGSPKTPYAAVEKFLTDGSVERAVEKGVADKSALPITGGHEVKEHGGAPVTPAAQTSSGQTPKR